MLEATKSVDAGNGVLHIVKNYTGDVMNFEMAAELAAAETGITVDTVVVNDDVAVQDSLYTAGRRGVGVTVLLEKLVGAAAEEGRSLTDLVALARAINDDGRSMGMARQAARCRLQGPPSSLAKTRWSWALAFMASPVGVGSRWRAPARLPNNCWSRSLLILTSRPAR